MKKIFKLMAVAAAAVAASACVNEIADANTDTELKEYLGPEFTAGFEVLTKTSISDGEGNEKVVSWEAGDEIALYYLDAEDVLQNTTARTEKGGQSATFKALDEIPETVTKFWAVYPADLTAEVSAEGKLTVTVPTKVAPTFRQANICAAVTSSDQMSFTFRNLTAIVKFTIPTENFSYCQLCNQDGGAICGALDAVFDEQGAVTVSSESTTYNIQPAGVPDVVTEGKGTFYVAVVPGKYTKGMAFNLVYSDKTQPAVFADKEIEFTRGHIVNFGEIDGRQVTDYYFTETGTGAGTSWSDAAGVNTFKTLFAAKTEKVEKYMQIWRTTGTTCHFGAGTYYLGDAENKRLAIDFAGANGSVVSNFTWLGGYPAEGGEARNPSANQTVFSGNEGKPSPILGIGARAGLTVDGVTFANGSAETGAAITFNSTGTQNISNCRFEGNMATGNGGALAVDESKIRINNCYFGGNKATYHGGAVFCNNASKSNGVIEGIRSSIFFNACVFENNEVSTAKSTSMGNDFYGNGTYQCYCFNNCSSSWSIKNVYSAIYCNKPYILANCTLMGKPHYKRGIIGDGNTTFKGHFINNIIINTNQSGNRPGIAYIPTDDEKNIEPTSYGSNIVSKYLSLGTETVLTPAGLLPSDYTASQYSADDESTDVASVTLGTYSWNAANGGWIWEGTVTATADDPWAGTNAADFKTALESITSTYSGYADGETWNYGQEFYKWLNSIGATNTDILGNVRTEPWWPGAYQAASTTSEN
ncbi:MAG: hypothetical protein IJ314_00465 [Bacteroidales bacterium]|nr:hypothetical protein [Bacteroidales bacterium]